MEAQPTILHVHADWGHRSSQGLPGPCCCKWHLLFAQLVNVFARWGILCKCLHLLSHCRQTPDRDEFNEKEKHKKKNKGETEIKLSKGS